MVHTYVNTGNPAEQGENLSLYIRGSSSEKGENYIENLGDQIRQNNLDARADLGIDDGARSSSKKTTVDSFLLRDDVAVRSFPEVPLLVDAADARLFFPLVERNLCSSWASRPDV